MNLEIHITSKPKKGSGKVIVTPTSFNSVKEWDGVVVSGEKYYVDKAVKLGATRSITKDAK